MPAPDRRQRAVRGASATSVLGPQPATPSETSPAAVGGPVKVRRFLRCGLVYHTEQTKKLECETKNKMMSIIGPVQSRYRKAVQ